METYDYNGNDPNWKSFLGGAVLIAFFFWLVVISFVGCGQNIIVNGDAWQDTDNIHRYKLN